ncbi:MAG: hypothetical protein ABUK01_14125 [Leptospirales bacterium]
MERASEDSKNSLSKYDLSMGLLRFFILLTIFIVPLYRQQQIYSAVRQVHWNISDHQWEKRKLRNHGPYLVEGKGGMQVLIGESEIYVRNSLGEPTRRSYGKNDVLYYQRRTYRGEIWLRKGFVVRIIFYAQKHISQSFHWRTAMGLRQLMVQDKSQEEAVDFILEFYEQPRHLVKTNTLNIHSRGILFQWEGDILRKVEIFEPWDYY